MPYGISAGKTIDDQARKIRQERSGGNAEKEEAVTFNTFPPGWAPGV